MTKLVAVVDPKTKEKKKAKYAKTGSICIVRVAVEKAICIEAFDNVAQVGVDVRGWLLLGALWAVASRCWDRGRLACECVFLAGEKSG